MGPDKVAAWMAAVMMGAVTTSAIVTWVLSLAKMIWSAWIVKFPSSEEVFVCVNGVTQVSFG